MAFEPGQEVWIAYFFATDTTKRPRRVHYTGYFEPVDPPLVEVRLKR